ncbi:MAG: hypothetical protein QHJ73_14650, partial [Armatimonadota bacterium]|nr:hypothetical protein [Armatimonadota bacterium]
MNSLTRCLFCAAAVWGAAVVSAADQPLPTLEEALAARTDVWGDAAQRQPDGPSYAFFASLLPPLRYVNAAFRHYPIVLSAPGAAVKPRLVSNGSAVNARAGAGTWREVGFPVTFYVGSHAALFGEELSRLEGPFYAKGYLPVVSLSYRAGGTYQQEVFAPVNPELSTCGAVWVRFASAAPGWVTARLGVEGAAEGNTLLGEKRETLAWWSNGWRWNAARRELTAAVSKNRPAFLAIYSVPREGHPPGPLTARAYDVEKRRCMETWEALLGQGARVEVPEPVVNNAWRSLVVGTWILTKGDRLCYSAGNAYERQYEAECGDAVRALLLWGQEARHLIAPLLDYVQPGLESHDAGFKLQLLAHAYWLTRDAALVRNQRARWEKAVAHIVEKREPATGLLPPERYCGDIPTRVYSLNSNANAWRG